VQPLWLQFSKAAASQTLPSRDEIREARSLVNWNDVVVSQEQVLFQKPGMAITLNGVAQGYAVDLAPAGVQARGVRHGVRDTGEFIGRGTRTADGSWLVGVQGPRRADGCAP